MDQEITKEQFRAMQAGEGALHAIVTVTRPDGSIKYQGPITLTPSKIDPNGIEE